MMASTLQGTVVLLGSHTTIAGVPIIVDLLGAGILGLLGMAKGKGKGDE